jgi:hypothetical protein
MIASPCIFFLFLELEETVISRRWINEDVFVSICTHRPGIHTSSVAVKDLVVRPDNGLACASIQDLKIVVDRHALDTFGQVAADILASHICPLSSTPATADEDILDMRKVFLQKGPLSPSGVRTHDLLVANSSEMGVSKS